MLNDPLAAAMAKILNAEKVGKREVMLKPSSNLLKKVLAILKKLPVKKIVDEGKSLAVYPIDIEKTIQGILSVIKEENLYLHDLDLRKPSLNEVFETIAAGK